MYLLLAFLLVPIVEIALFIQVGGIIGLWPTLAIVVLTAVLGTWLVKTQGRMALGHLQTSFQKLDDPTEPLAHGAMILVAGALLLTPGFFTDAVGFSLLMPPVRMAVFRFLKSRITMTQFQMGPGSMHSRSYSGDQGDIIDGEYEDVSQKNPNQGTSGWVKGPDQG